MEPKVALQGVNCYDCVFYGVRDHMAVQSFCSGCMGQPGFRRYCFAYETEEHLLRPVSMNGQEWMEPDGRRAVKAENWALLEWSARRHSYVYAVAQ